MSVGNTVPPAATGTPRARLPTVRAVRQRQRILDAAEKCFIESGFHAASMAHIAQTADMSAGLIYRYFDSKALIVKAIIERHMESDKSKMAGRLNGADDVSRSILELFECWRRGNDPKISPVLMVELTAESTRDPEIARVVRTKDLVFGEAIALAVRRSARSRGVRLTPAVTRSRAVMLQCLVEGLALRLMRDPKLQWRTIKPAMDAIIAVLMG